MFYVFYLNFESLRTCVPYYVKKTLVRRVPCRAPCVLDAAAYLRRIRTG